MLASAVVLLSGCSSAAGTPGPALKGPPIDPGHGSVAEVAQALDAQGVPCLDPRPSKQAPEGMGLEEAVECDLQPSGELVLLVHFGDDRGDDLFEDAERQADRHAVYADAWGARTVTRDAADLVARAVRSRGSS